MLLRRMFAYAVDGLILFSALALSQAALAALNLNPLLRQMAAAQAPGAAQLHLWVLASVSIPFWLYYALWHSSRWQATPGKRWLGLRLESQRGGRLPFWQALARSVAVLLPFEINHAVIFHLADSQWLPAGLALVWLLIIAYAAAPLLSARRLALHDLATGTRVVSAHKEIV